MRDEDFLHRVRNELSPQEGSKDRVRKMMMARVRAPEMLRQVHADLTPSADQKKSLWPRVQREIAPLKPTSVLEKLRGFLSPTPQTQQMLRERLLSRLMPQQPAPNYRAVKWISAFALLLIIVRTGSPLLIAPRSMADSSVLVIPTQGISSVLQGGFWQPVKSEVTLSQGARFRTDTDGGMTIILHDDGNVRLGSNTMLALYDISDRPEPALNASTMEVPQGKIWVQGLLPEHLRGITITTPFGDVVLHAGSVSIEVGDTVKISVWDGQVTVNHASQSQALVAGDYIELYAQNTPQVHRVSDAAYDDNWVKQNLERDAAHRREVAQWQQERRAAAAGVLPNSILYPLKRAAEQVDILLTFDGQQRVQKKLDLASIRLNEAAALIAQGDSGASVPLAEYKAALQDVANGTDSGSTTVTQFLLQQEIAENTAQLSAASPDDQVYQVKKAVLEAGASLPQDVVDQRDVQGTILVDTLNAVHEAVDSGDIQKAKDTFAQLQPYLDSLQGQNDELKPEVRREAIALLSNVTSALGEGEQNDGSGSVQKDLLKEVSNYVPKVKTNPTMKEEQIVTMVQGMYNRIFLYTQPRARWNQLEYEMAQIHGNPDEGTILRHLYHALPENGLAKYVRTEIQKLREQVESAE